MQGKLIFLLLALVGVSLYMSSSTLQLPPTLQLPSQLIKDFQEWKARYGKRYGSPDHEAFRMNIFYENSLYIAEQNMIQSEYVLGETQFMDLTKDEFTETYLGLITQPSFDLHEESEVSSTPSNDVDWRTKGAVSAIKDQGSCGSCWAFSTTGCLEGLGFIKKGTLQNFSEQQLVDCSTSYGNQGCNGGLMDNAFRYVKDHGIVTQSEYPYTGKQGTCKTNQGPFKITGYTDVTRGNIDSLKAAITQQPNSVAVDASNWSFYKGGVFSNCGTNLNHGVTGVGFTADYWIIKNSWATSWGEQGFMRLKMGNTCGIANMASWATM